MKLPLLYRGLLYALRETLSDKEEGRFESDGDRFHAAFRAMLVYAQTNVPEIPARELLENFDPVFGVSPEATEMLLEGERDFIVSLPRLRVAQFKISKDLAKKELDKLPSAEIFRKLATRFHEHGAPNDAAKTLIAEPKYAIEATYEDGTVEVGEVVFASYEEALSAAHEWDVALGTDAPKLRIVKVG